MLFKCLLIAERLRNTPDPDENLFLGMKQYRDRAGIEIPMLGVHTAFFFLSFFFLHSMCFLH